ncbi:MAG: hypothetical protein F4Z63_02635, partial [Gammaproteobacteria bacterium]|nr:hypothetical protein [Gammaproteobacteria bacterium]
MAEGDAGENPSLTFTVTLSNPSARTVTVDWADTDTGSATSGTDYADPAGGTLTFAPNETSKTVAVAVTGDALDEGNETVILRLSNPSNAHFAGNVETLDATGTITDDDTPELSIDSPSVAEGDAGENPSLTFTVTLSNPSARTVTVDWADTDTGSATSGTDYADPAGGTLTFAPNETSKTVAVAVTGDALDEGNETVILRLSGPSNAKFAGNAKTLDGAGAINDDDAKSSLVLEVRQDRGSAKSVAESQTQKFRVTARLQNAASVVATDRTLSVVVGSASDSAREGVDYHAVADFPLVIPANTQSGSATFDLRPKDDQLREGDEALSVAVSLPGEGAARADVWIIDDDTPYLKVNEPRVKEGAAGSEATLRFRVELSSNPEGTVTVDYRDTESGTATSGTDYGEIAPGTLTFAAGETLKTVDVAVKGDDVDEPDETIVLQFSDFPYARRTYGEKVFYVAGTVVRDETENPEVSIALKGKKLVTEGSDPGEAVFVLSLDKESKHAVEVEYELSGKAQSGADYETPQSMSVSIPAGSTSAELVLKIKDDSIDEPHEDIGVTIVSASNAIVSSTAKRDVVLIVDDDDAPVLSVADVSVVEGTRLDPSESSFVNMKFTLTLSEPSGYEASLKFTTVEGAATHRDYQFKAANLAIQPGETEASVTVKVIKDALDEDDETFKLRLSSPNRVTFKDGANTLEAVGTIEDDDDRGIEATPLALTLAEPDGASAYEVVLTSGPTADVVIKLSSSDESVATVSPKRLRFKQASTGSSYHWNQPQSVTVTAVDDTLSNQGGGRAATISHEVVVGQSDYGSVTAPDVAVTVTDDEVPSFSVADASAAEGSAITFTVTRSGDKDEAASVYWNTKADTAGANPAGAADYTEATTAAKLDFAANEDEQTFTVDTTQDTLAEADETFLVELSNPSEGAEISDGEATGTIEDDEATPTVTLKLAPATIDESGAANASTVTAELSGESSAAVTVAVSLADDAPAALSDNAELTIAAGSTDSTGTVTVTATDNTVDAPNASVAVEGAASGGHGVAAPDDATLTINDDDDTPSFSVADASATEGGDISFTVSRAGAAGNVVSVDWATALATGDTAAAANDFAHSTTAQTLAFAAGDTAKTVTVATTADSRDEPDETFELKLSNAAKAEGDPGGAPTITDDTAIGTITDDDAAPTALTLTVDADTSAANAQDSVTEDGGAKNARVTATLDGSTTFDKPTVVTVTVGKDGDAASSDDYTAVAPLTITIPAGESSATGDFTLTPTDDSLDEDAETLSLTGTAGTLTVTDTTIKITDDDDPPVLSIAAASAAEGSGVAFTVSLAPVSGRDVTVQWVTADDGDAANAATADEDYTAVAATTATIAAGATSATVTVATINDDRAEPSETFLVELSSPTNATLSPTAAQATGTITDSDAPPTSLTLTVDADTSAANVQDSVAEDGGAKTARVTATLDGSTTFDKATVVTVTVGKSTDVAIEDTDYTAVAPVTITIPAGESSAYADFALTPTDDDLDENEEALSLTGSAGTLTVTPAAIKIADDDDPPVLSIAAASAAEGSGVAFTVSLAPVSGRDVTVQWVTADDGDAANAATADEDYTAVAATTATIAAGANSATVTVNTLDDVRSEQSETFLVKLSSPVSATLSATASEAVGTITDSDAAPTGLNLSVDADKDTANAQDSVAEDGGSKTARVTATLDGSTTFDAATEVTVTVGKAGDTASSKDYTAPASFKITIPAGKASATADFMLTPTNDTLDENDESLSLTGSSGTLTVTDTAIKITDDDDPPALSIADAAAVTEGAQASFTISLGAESGRSVTVQWATADDAGGTNAATAGEDYTAVAATTATIPAGDTEATVTVSTTDDSRDEPAETFLVKLTTPGNATLASADATATGTINDNDNAPTAVTLTVDADTSAANAQDSVAEDGGAKTARVTATLGGSTTFDAATEVTVTVGKAGDAATSADYAASPAAFTIAIPAGESSATADFTLTPTNDKLDENDEALSLTGSAGSLTVSGATIKIMDDDGLPALSIADADAVTEGGQASFAITLTPASGRDVTVKWATADDSGANPATAGEDYTAVTATTATIAAGATEATVTVDTLDDSRDEPAETFLVKLSSPGSATLATADATATGTINDDDAAPASLILSVDADASTTTVETAVAEEGGAKTARVTATLGGSTTFDAATEVTVTVGKAGDAASSADYAASPASFKITIPAGESSAYADFTLTPTSDALDEDDETLTLSGTSGAFTIADIAVGITDDDALPVLSIADASAVTEGDAGDTAASMTFTVSLSAASGRAVTAPFTLGGTATAGDDYTKPSPLSATIAAGGTSAEVAIAVLGDDLDEGNETITLTLGSPTNATVSTVEGAGAATGTITDDDTRGLTATPAAVTVAEPSGTATYQLALASRPTAEVTVTLASSDTAIATVSPQTLTFPAADWAKQQAVTVTAADDKVDNAGGERTATIDHTASGGDYGSVTGSAAVTVTDEDGAPTGITLTASPDSVAEDGGAKTVTVTAAVTGGTTYDAAVEVTVSVGASDDSAAEGTDYDTQADLKITIPAGQASASDTFTLTPKQDAVSEGSESISVEGSAGETVTVKGDEITLTDDEALPVATLKLSPSTIDESGATNVSTVTATLDRASSAETTIAVSLPANAPATLSQAATLTIAAGSKASTGTVTVTATDNKMDAADAVVKVKGAASGGHGVADPTDATLTIRDDDDAPSGITLTASPDSAAENGAAVSVTVTAAVTGGTTYGADTEVTVSVGASDDSAKEGADYDTVDDFKIDIAAGNTSATHTFTLTPKQDALAEGGESISVDGSAGETVTVTGDTIALTDDDAPAIALTVDADTGAPGDQGKLGEGGGAKTVRVTATLGGDIRFPVDKTVTVEVGKASDSAKEGTDYATVGQQTVTIKAGAASGSAEFALTPTQDALAEAGETISVEGSLTGATVTGASITLEDDDSAPTALTLTVDADTSTTSAEGALSEGGGAKTVRVTATLSGETRFPDDSTVTVEVGKASDSAAEGTDYATVGQQTITLTAGSASGSVEFPLTPTQDDVSEGDETISVEGSLGDLTVTGAAITLEDDESAPTVTLKLSSATIKEAGDGNASTVTATLSGESDEPVTVTVSLPAGARAALSSNKALTIAAGSKNSTGTVTITAQSDDIDHPSQAVAVSGAASGGGVANPEDVTLTIEDDEDTPTVTLKLTPATIDESGGNNASTVTATLSGKSGEAVTVKVSLPDGAPATVSENADLTIAAGATESSGTVTVTATDNKVDAAGDATVNVQGTASGGHGVASPSAVALTITDDDTAPKSLAL